ncbi:ATPase related with DNA repair [Anaerolinea thermolimosa]|uniref:AAA family ATPase n=1 Tax=Anaerolinea thermolimosa TaxID=229919 RepID=UPI00078237B4|nr:SMC family ATPase [Anaerolinea thermolimosa]GAP06099.1 ATPase related with DNA repair [Anaerolinea thermolimosa]
MIPSRLYLSGFLSYQDPVEVDFTPLELACISGSNGAGKSSLLDAITWALFGEARGRDADALINNQVNSAEVILDFDYENNRYRIQRSKSRGKTTLLELYVLSPEGQWRAMTEKSVRETENRLRSILRMNYETFINASFFLQGKADQFTQQQPANRKKVLTNVLGLEVWESYRMTAAEKRRGVEYELQVLENQQAEISAELSQEKERKARLAELEEQLDQLVNLRQAKESELISLQRLAASLEEQRRLVGVLKGRLDETRGRLTQYREQKEKLEEQRIQLMEKIRLAKDVEAAYQQWIKDRETLADFEKTAEKFREIVARRNAPLSAIQAARSALEQELRTLRENAEAMERSEAKLATQNQELPLLQGEIQALEEQIAQRKAYEAEVQSLQEMAATMKAENERLKAEMHELRGRIDQLQEMEGAICPLCGQPLSPEERRNLIEALEAEGRQKGDAYRGNQARLKENEEKRLELGRKLQALEKAEGALRIATREYDQVEAEIQRLQAEITNWKNSGAKRLEEVQRILKEEDFALEAREALAEIDREALNLGYDAAAHEALRQAEELGRRSEQALREIEAARATLEPLERQIADLEEKISREADLLSSQEKEYQEAEQKFIEDSAELPDPESAEAELQALKAKENRLRMDVGMVRQSVAVLDVLRERQGRLSQKRAELAIQINRLKILERAFSKDGVPALLIEQALPEIEDQANAILDRLSNGRMSVRFETLRGLKSKKDEKRETLDIVISDAMGERAYEMFSGGEAFRVNFAIRLALSRVLAHRAGARLQTLFIDEGFGSQDAEGRQRLLEAINLVRSDFAKIIVITHLEDLKEAFPSRIEVEKTVRGSRLRVVA